jgi:hypothetical protein
VNNFSGYENIKYDGFLDDFGSEDDEGDEKNLLKQKEQNLED